MSSETQMDPMIAIKKIIDKAGIDGALTEDAIKYFNNTVIDNRELKEDNKLKATELENKSEELNSYATRCNVLKNENDAWKTREGDIVQREKQMTILELTAKHESKRVQDHKDMFDKVFRNIETRRNVFTPIPGTDGGQYQTPIGGFAQENEEKTEKS